MVYCVSTIYTEVSGILCFHYRYRGNWYLLLYIVFPL